MLRRALATLILAQLAVAEACARAGGGGHSGSSGGGHSGGGHGGFSYSGGGSPYTGSGGGGGGSLVGLLFIIMLVLIAWYLYRRLRTPPSDGFGQASSSPIGRDAIGAGVAAGLGASAAGLASAAGNPAAPQASLPAALAAIPGADPGFELESFLQRAEMTFFLVKRALQHNDAAGVRAFLDPALYERVARGIAAMSTQHRHTLLESLNVRAVHPVSAQCDEHQQQIQVHFDLVYRAKTLDDDNHVLADDGDDRRRGERWTFVRAASARTPTDGGVTASRCPACGAELRLSLEGTCSHCKANVTNGSVDWVVTAVEGAPFIGYARDATFSVAAPTVAAGLATLHQADPAFALEPFLARVRTAFTTLQQAWCAQNLETGRAFLSQGAYFAWRSQLETMTAEGRRNVMEHLTITGVRPVRVVHGRVYDDVTLRIEAACADYEVDAGGKLVFGSRSVEPFAELWTFQRSIGTATSGKPGTLENTCPSCGAPVALTQIGECRYCRAAITSGRFDWVVSRIEQEDEGDDDQAGEPPSPSPGAALAVGAVAGLLGALLDD